jgi:hypothetical protein
VKNIVHVVVASLFVSTLVHEVLTAGMNTKQWNTRIVQSGFYLLHTGLYLETKKLVVAR